MKSELRSYRTEEMVTYDVADGPVVRMKYGHQDLRLDRVTVYCQKRDGSDWRVTEVAGFGRRILKDGRPGVDRRESSWGGYELHRAPGWAQEFAKLAMERLGA